MKTNDSEKPLVYTGKSVLIMSTDRTWTEHIENELKGTFSIMSLQYLGLAQELVKQNTTDLIIYHKINDEDRGIEWVAKQHEAGQKIICLRHTPIDKVPFIHIDNKKGGDNQIRDLALKLLGIEQKKQ